MKKEDCYKTRNLKINWACPSPYSVAYSYFGHTYLMHSYKYSATRDQWRRWCRRISDELTFHQTPALHPAALLEADPRLTPAHAYSWCGWLITPCTERPAGVGRKPPPKAPATDKLRYFSWLLQFLQIRNFINFCWHIDTAVTTSGNQTSTSLECLGGDGRHHPDDSLAVGVRGDTYPEAPTIIQVNIVTSVPDLS